MLQVQIQKRFDTLLNATFLYTIFKKPSEQYWSKLSMYIIDTRELTLTIKLSAMLMPLTCYIMA